MDVWHKYVVTWIFTKYYKYKVLNVEMTIRLLLDVIANQCPCSGREKKSWMDGVLQNHHFLDPAVKEGKSFKH